MSVMLIDWLLMVNFKDGSSMYQRDSNEAFENAKTKGLNKPSEFMYMYSQNNRDYFKNINFRNYINFAQ